MKQYCKFALAMLALAFTSAIAGDAAVGEEDVGLIGRRMAQSSGRVQAVRGGGAFASVGNALVGKLTASKPESANEPAQVLGLRDLNVNVELDGMTARTTIMHVFKNETSDLLEGCFTFTLPPDVAVDRFAMTINTETDLMEGELIGRGEALNTYSDLVYGRGVDPGVLEWLNTNTFKATIFPIPAKKTKTIVISYLQMLAPRVQTDGSQELTYHCPFADRKEITSLASNYRFRATLTGLPARADIQSNLEATLVPGAKATTLSMQFDDKNVPANDWQIRVALPRTESKLTGDCSVQAHKPGAQPGKFAVTLMPQSVETPAAMDVIFAVDTSANRSGAEHFATTKMIEGALKCLSADDRFGLMTFDVTARTLPGGLLAPTAENIEKAVEFLNKIKPLGATDLGTAFKTLKDSYREIVGAQSAVIYVGDLKATYGEKCGAELGGLMQDALDSCKGELHCVWTGAGSIKEIDQHAEAVRDLVRLSGAPVVYLTRDVRPADVGRKLMQNVDQAILRHAEVSVVDEKNNPLELTPRIVGGIPAGIGTTIYGEYGRGQQVTVTLTGMLRNQTYRREWKLKLPNEEKANGAVAKLWARSRIGELQYADPSSAQTISKEYKVVCKDTAFLVLESEQMYNDFRIARANRSDLNSDQLRSKFLCGLPQIPDVNKGGMPKADTVDLNNAANGLRLDLQTGYAAPKGPIEIHDTLMRISLQHVSVPERQFASGAALTRAQCTERRLALTRLIAVERGLPFEPETVLPAVWFDSLALSPETLVQRFCTNSEDAIVHQVRLQPVTPPAQWKPSRQALTESDMQIECVLDQVQHTSVRASRDGTKMIIDGNLLTHHIAHKLLLNKDWELTRNHAAHAERMRMVKSRVALLYPKQDVPAARLSALYNFLAQVTLVEGQPELAEKMAAEAMKYAPENLDQSKPVQLSYLIQAFAANYRSDFEAAAAAYQKMLEIPNQKLLMGRALTYRALINTMLFAGNIEGAIMVLERWAAEEKYDEAIVLQLGKAYLATNAAWKAIRAFSTVAEFNQARGAEFATPDEFLRRKDEFIPLKK